MAKLVSFYGEGQRIRGNLHLPCEGAPCLLMSHGFESSKDGNKWLVLALTFCDEGFASLRFSYRGCGEGSEKSILIIHGSLDEAVPVENAYELYDNANEPKRLEIIEGASHAFEDAGHLEKVMNFGLQWFRSYL